MHVIERLGSCEPGRVIALNNASETETSRLDAVSYASLLAASAYARRIGEGPRAILIAMDATPTYQNVNFGWFQKRYTSFTYIDRVVAAEQARGQGLARALYADLVSTARTHGHGHICCEINIEPPNPASDAFHSALDFYEVGQAVLGNSGKHVRYLAKELR